MLLDIDSNAGVLISTAQALSRFGHLAQANTASLLHAVDAALFRNPNNSCVDHLVAALTHIDPDPERTVREFYEEGNEEHRDLILAMLQDYHRQTSPTS